MLIFIKADTYIPVDHTKIDVRAGTDCNVDRNIVGGFLAIGLNILGRLLTIRLWTPEWPTWVDQSLEFVQVNAAAILIDQNGKSVVVFLNCIAFGRYILLEEVDIHQGLGVRRLEDP